MFGGCIFSYIYGHLLVLTLLSLTELLWHSIKTNWLYTCGSSTSFSILLICMIIYTENTKKSINNLLELMSKFKQSHRNLGKM
jgi:hypothetical protein